MKSHFEFSKQTYIKQSDVFFWTPTCLVALINMLETVPIRGEIIKKNKQNPRALRGPAKVVCIELNNMTHSAFVPWGPKEKRKKSPVYPLEDGVLGAPHYCWELTFLQTTEAQSSNLDTFAPPTVLLHPPSFFQAGPALYTTYTLVTAQGVLDGLSWRLGALERQGKVVWSQHSRFNQILHRALDSWIQ